MGDKAYLYVLRTIRHLQSCSCSLSLRAPQCTRAYTSSTFLSSIKPAVKTPQFSSSLYAASLRFLTTVTPVNLEETKIQSDLNDQSLVGVPSSLAQDIKNPLEVDPEANYLNLAEEAEYNQGTSLRELRDSLKQCVSPSDVLDLCSSPVLSPKFVCVSFTTMWVISRNIKQKQGERNLEKQLMFEHQNFENLCRQAMQSANKMTSDDLVSTLHAVISLQVPQTTRLVQTLLRVCQERLNHLKERDIAILASSLNQMESCTNVDLLRKGLQLLVEVRLPEIRMVKSLQTMMRCIGKDAPVTLVKKIEEKALRMLNQFTLPNCQYMFSSLAAINLRSLPLLTFCKRVVIDNLSSIPFWKMIHILNACHQLSYRDEELTTAIGDYVLDTLDMWHTKQVLIFLLNMELLGCRHVSLLDRFAEKVIEKPELLSLKDILNTVKVYSLLNHLPEGRSQEFLEVLNSSLQLYLPRISPPDLLKVVFYFCTMGFFPPQPLEKLMKDEVVYQLLHAGITAKHVEQNQQMLKTINLCLQLDNSPSTMPEDLEMMTVPSFHSKVLSDIDVLLRTIVGDAAQIQKSIRVFNSHYMDFLLTMNPDPSKDSPVADAQSLNKHNPRLAILCVHMSHFALGTLRPLGMMAMKIRHLEAAGFHVVMVPLHKFKNLNAEEKELLLRSQIFSENISADAH
ncbi:FAST kinase domain-containing protein 2, mitochondrial [Pelodytes ibericus]